jgi:AraC-like DNA-binding protein
MRRAEDRAAYVRDPIGRFVDGRTWIRFCPKEDFVGGLFWGFVTNDDFRAYLDVVVDEAQAIPFPRLSYLDARRIESVEEECLSTLGAFYTEHATDLQRSIRRLAGVHPTGWAGAVIGGLTQVQSFPYPTRFCASPRDALEFLGAAEVSLEPLIDDLLERAIATTSTVRALQGLLEKESGRIAVHDAASRLGLSTRSLQRRLREADTTFAREQSKAQLRVAKKLLAETDASLLSIALTVGCGSAQHFSNWFRQASGEPPSRFRSRQRKARPRR